MLLHLALLFWSCFCISKFCSNENRVSSVRTVFSGLVIPFSFTSDSVFWSQAKMPLGHTVATAFDSVIWGRVLGFWWGFFIIFLFVCGVLVF